MAPMPAAQIGSTAKAKSHRPGRNITKCSTVFWWARTWRTYSSGPSWDGAGTLKRPRAMPDLNKVTSSATLLRMPG